MPFFVYFSLLSLLLLAGSIMLLVQGIRKKRKDFLSAAVGLFVLLASMYYALMRFLIAI
ncbi:MAG: hypothetical protein HFF84_10230 [Oscillibacter sp.]|nr:hypothetical protein [Oscillibacter sp.]